MDSAKYSPRDSIGLQSKHASDMWVRIIGKKGNAQGFAIPKAAMRALGWERGDHLLIYLHNKNAIVVTKLRPEKRPDLIIAARELEAQAEAELDEIKI